MSEHEPICPSVPVLATPLTWGWNRQCIFRCRQRLRPLVREGTPRVDTPQYDRVLALTEVQLEGKKRMDTEAFLRGYEVLPGTVLGQEEA